MALNAEAPDSPEVVEEDGDEVEVEDEWCVLSEDDEKLIEPVSVEVDEEEDAE